MMDLENYGHSLGQNPHKYFHNLCMEFTKTLQKSKDPALLEIEMEKLINASKQMKWKNTKKEVWKKDEGEKALSKVWNEFSRYMNALRSNQKNANMKDLLQSLSEVQRLIENLRVS